MPDDQFHINPSALEPLFAPWEEPNAHRLRGDKPGDPAKVVKTRRPSPIAIVNNLRMAVREWREAYHIGASDTTRHSLHPRHVDQVGASPSWHPWFSPVCRQTACHNSSLQTPVWAIALPQPHYH